MIVRSGIIDTINIKFSMDRRNSFGGNNLRLFWKFHLTIGVFYDIIDIEKGALCGTGATI